MSKIWSMMDVGRRSLANSQTALQTTAHNISNKSTEGYSRQRVEQVTALPVGEGKLRVGMGARVTDVTRTNNEFLEKQIEREGSQLGFLGARSDLLTRVEDVYNEQVNKGLNHSIGMFFNSFRELSNNPESLATRTQVKESAEQLGKDFQKVNGQLNEIQKDADFRITTKIHEVNQLTKEIANLNGRVASQELAGGQANDERDRRDLLVKQLSEKINIKYAENESGQLTITGGNTAVLVSGFQQRDLAVAPTPARDGKKEGDIDIFYKATDHSTPVNITAQLTGGEVGGLLQVRDKVVNQFRSDMDTVAYTLGSEVNQAHIHGYDRNGRQGNLLFDQPVNRVGASANFQINKELAADVSKIATAADKNAPGDNRIANIISKLEYKQCMGGGTATINDFYSSMVGKIGIEAQRAASSHQSQQDSVAQLKNLRESISGVSLDEETTKMIEYQKGFDASARLVRTADEMMDTVLNLKRL